MITLKRAYEPYEPTDGYRVLIDRRWPRGLSRARAHLDEWARDIAPSDALREWYGHDPAKWPEFQKRFRQELTAPAAQDVLTALAQRARRGRVTLVFASRAADISNAAVLGPLLSRRSKRSPRTR